MHKACVEQLKSTHTWVERETELQRWQAKSKKKKTWLTTSGIWVSKHPCLLSLFLFSFCFCSPLIPICCPCSYSALVLNSLNLITQLISTNQTYRCHADCPDTASNTHTHTPHTHTHPPTHTHTFTRKHEQMYATVIVSFCINYSPRKHRVGLYVHILVSTIFKIVEHRKASMLRFSPPLLSFSDFFE